MLQFIFFFRHSFRMDKSLAIFRASDPGLAPSYSICSKHEHHHYCYLQSGIFANKIQISNKSFGWSMWLTDRCSVEAKRCYGANIIG